MKYYDKYLTPISKEIQQMLIMLAVFIIGFIAGYFMGSWEKQTDDNNVVNKVNKVNTANIEMSSNVLYNS